MQQTYLSLKELANLHQGETDISKLALQYQVQEEPIIFSYVFCQLFPYIVTQVEKYFYLTEQDKASFAMEELHKAMLDFDPQKGAKIQTLYSRYLNNRLRAETQMLNHQKRKCNNGAESYEEVAVTYDGYMDDSYNHVELVSLLESVDTLTENEYKYCRIVMDKENEGLRDSDIAKSLGITSAAVSYIRKSLQKKLALMLT